MKITEDNFIKLNSNEGDILLENKLCCRGNKNIFIKTIAGIIVVFSILNIFLIYNFINLLAKI